MLIISAIQDCLYKKIDIILPLCTMAIIDISKLLCGETGVVYSMLSVTPGIVLLLISVFGKGIIGSADGVIICFIGVCEGLYTNINIVLLSFVIAWIVILYKLVIRRNRIKNIVIPYVPCIALAWFCIRIKGWLL